MRIWVDVYDANENRLGTGPVENVQSADVTRALDGAGNFSVRVPGTDVRALTLFQPERRVKIWVEDLGGKRLMGEGIIRKRRMAESPTGVSLVIDGPDMLDELKRRNVLLGRIYNQQTVSTVVNSLIALVPGWGAEIEGTIADDVIDARYDGVSILKAFQDLASRYGYHIRPSGTNSKTLEIGPFGDDNGLRVMKVEQVTLETLANPQLLMVQQIQKEDDSEEVVNWLLPIGAGEGVGALTLAKSTRSSPYTIQSLAGPDGTTLYYLADSTSIGLYDEIRKVGQFKEIAPLSNSATDIANAANALYDAAVEFLTRHTEPQEVYRVMVKNAQQSIQPGDKVHIHYKAQVEVDGELVDYLSIRDDFWVLRATETVGLDSTDVELEISNVDRYQEDVAEVIIGAIENIELRNLKPQIGVSVRTYVYDREIASGFTAKVPIEFTDATLDLHRCRLRLKTSPFRVTATAAQSTPSTHQHLIMRSNDGTPLQAGLAVQRFSIVEQTTGTIYHFDASSDVGAGARFFDMQPSGSHTHNLTYGIQDDTVTPVDVTVKVNGTDRTNLLFGSSTLAPSGGNLDVLADEGELTDLLLNDAGGLRQEHDIEILCASGQGRCEVTVEVFEVIQAIKLL